MRWRKKSEADIPTHTQMVASTSKEKEVLSNIDTLKLMLDQKKKEYEEALRRVGEISGDYEDLKRAYRGLLLTAGEALITGETALRQSLELTQKALAGLATALEQQGVERFAPHRGDPAADGGYVVEGELETWELRPGLVASVLAPGLRLKGGEVLARPRVLVSVEPRRLKEQGPDLQVEAGTELGG